MSFFSDERAAELRELFFEGAQDLLQEMNEAGILIEADPCDSDALARVRRAMHTLKGDSAACGFRQLSELAHDLEDLLTPAFVAERGEAVAEIILAAADTFHAMLGVVRGNLQPPDITEFRAHIRTLAKLPASSSAPQPSQARAEWTPKEKAIVLEALRNGEVVHEIVLSVDPSLQMPAAGLQMICTALDHCGTVLAQSPASGVPLQTLAEVHVALSSSYSPDWIRTRCAVPGIVTSVSLTPMGMAESQPRDVLQMLLEAEAKAGSELTSTASDERDERDERDEHDQRDEHSALAGEETSRTSATAAGKTGSAEAWLRVENWRIDTVMNLIGELIIGKSMLIRTLQEFDRKFPKDPLRNRLGDAVSFQSRVLGELQKSVMKIRMVPVEQLFRRLPRIVRDVAKARQKEIAVEMAGQGTDLDKSVLDALAEAMAHLVRNAADHGIEAPHDRLTYGKSSRGTIRLNAFHQGNQVVIEVSDDGRGISSERLVQKAIQSGLMSEEEARGLSREEILNLVFHPGLTTAEQVTEISGRGVGMDVVKNVMNRLKGKVIVESKPGHGTTFQLVAPLTLASIQALLFRVDDRHYAIPLDSVLEITRANDSEIHEIDGHEVLRIRDQAFSVVRLDQLILDTKSTVKKMRHFVVTVAEGNRRVGLIVDGLIGEEELVIKAIEDRLVSSDLISGGSILGDGTVVLILNVPALVSHLGRKRTVGVPA